MGCNQSKNVSYYNEISGDNLNHKSFVTVRTQKLVQDMHGLCWFTKMVGEDHGGNHRHLSKVSFLVGSTVYLWCNMFPKAIIQLYVGLQKLMVGEDHEGKHRHISKVSFLVGSTVYLWCNMFPKATIQLYQNLNEKGHLGPLFQFRDLL